MFWTDFNKRLVRHVKDLKRFGFLPDGWKWHPEIISALNTIDNNLINDLSELHKRHKLTPDLFVNVEPLVFNLHNDLQGILHGTLTDKTDAEREKVNNFIMAIEKLLSDDNRKIIEKVKSKIFDITRDGTLIHLLEMYKLETVWTEGLKSGSAIKLGPIDRYPNGIFLNSEQKIITKITLEEVSGTPEELYGWVYGTLADFVIKGSLNWEDDAKFLKPTTKIDLDQYVNNLRKGGPFKNIKFPPIMIAFIRNLTIKYKSYPPTQVIENERDARVIGYLSSILNDLKLRYWDMGLIINPDFAKQAYNPISEMDDMPNEYKFIEGNPREQILGILCTRKTHLEHIMYIMFKLTKNTPEDRVPIYLMDGSVAWPK